MVKIKKSQFKAELREAYMAGFRDGINTIQEYNPTTEEREKGWDFWLEVNDWEGAYGK